MFFLRLRCGMVVSKRVFPSLVRDGGLQIFFGYLFSLLDGGLHVFFSLRAVRDVEL